MSTEIKNNVNLDEDEIPDRATTRLGTKFSEGCYSSNNSVNREPMGSCVQLDRDKTAQPREPGIKSNKPIIISEFVIRINLQKRFTKYSLETEKMIHN